MRGAEPSPPDAEVNVAARAGDLEKVIALVDAGAAIGAWTTSCAAASGSVALLRELVQDALHVLQAHPQPIRLLAQLAPLVLRLREQPVRLLMQSLVVQAVL